MRGAVPRRDGEASGDRDRVDDQDLFDARETPYRDVVDGDEIAQQRAHCGIETVQQPDRLGRGGWAFGQKTAQVPVRAAQRVGELRERSRPAPDRVGRLRLRGEDGLSIVDELQNLRQVTIGVLQQERVGLKEASQRGLVAFEGLSQFVDHDREVLDPDRAHQLVEAGQQGLHRQRRAGLLARDGVAVAQVRLTIAVGAQIHVLLPDRRSLGHHRAQVGRHPNAAVDPKRHANAIAGQRNRDDPADRHAPVSDRRVREDASGHREVKGDGVAAAEQPIAQPDVPDADVGHAEHAQHDEGEHL